MPRYVLESHSRTLDLGHGKVEGAPVKNLFEFEVTLDETVEQILAWPVTDGPGYRTRMPPGWTMTLEGDPWDRYKRTLLKDGTRRFLYDAVDFPKGHPKRPGRE
jgi:hypothetical protein